MSGAESAGEAVLPVFPLTGVLLLPGAHLPLHVFEPRYRNMVRDALDGERRIGLIQPLEPADDNRVPADDVADEDRADEVDQDRAAFEQTGDDRPELYRVGCAGEIEQWEELEDGRFVILLRGVRRFRVRRELPLHRGYRRVAATWEDEPEDDELAPDAVVSLLAALRDLARGYGLEVDFEHLDKLPPRTLLDALAMGLPLAPAEKQALLEASSSDERRRILASLIEMGLELDPPPPSEPPTAH